MRLLNRPLAFILAAALAVAAIIVIIEVISKGVGHGPLVLHWTTWYHWAKRTHWNQTVIVVWSAILIVIGLLILIIELKPRRVTRLSLRSDQRATDAAVTRGGLAGTLRAAATRVDGVSAAAVVVRAEAELARALAAALRRDGPTVIDALVDPASYPVIMELSRGEAGRQPLPGIEPAGDRANAKERVQWPLPWRSSGTSPREPSRGSS